MTKNIEFYNFPKLNPLADYDMCIIRSLKYLVRKYPDCTIYKVGGESIKKGISDIDMLIVSNHKFNGNHLYLRNLPVKYIKNGILMHEFFTVDKETFKHLNKLTSYNIQPLIYGKNTSLVEIEPSNELFNFYKLTYYLLINYPMNFYSWEIESKINVRRSLTKLKKLKNFEKLFKETFDENIHFLPEKFKQELDEVLENYPSLSKKIFSDRVLNLLKQAQKICIDIFRLYEDYSSNYVQIKDESQLKINDLNIVFSDDWRKNLYANNKFYAPKNLAIFNTVLQGIDRKFLANISFSTLKVNLKEFDELGKIINNYLHFCERSNLNQLIVDINFSLSGYSSLKYKAYQTAKSAKSIIKLKK